MSFTLIQAIWSVVVLVTFLGIVAWAYSRKRKADFDEAARVPFEDDPVNNNSAPSEEKSDG